MTRQHSRIGCVLDVTDQCHADVYQGVIAELPQQQDMGMPSTDEYQLAKAGEV
jgi:hypothetical protein